ncbi:MAG: hypothetical protein ACYDDF_07590 [Thermoplasmatota archaeon]
MIMPPNPDGVMRVNTTTSGPYQLIFATRGGSDGQATGDYISYAVKGTSRQT